MTTLKPAGELWRWIGAVVIVVIAVMRCCVVFTPQLVFDADPAFDNSLPAALGMGGSLLLDVLLILGCLIGLLGEMRSGRGIDPVLLSLAIVPLPVIYWHGSVDAGDMWRGATWVAAMLACVTVAHLARDRAFRTLIAAALFAACVPLLVRGAAQVTWEHAATVQAFEQTRSEFFAARGWAEDSPAARIYERRLMQREPIGWFASTNIYASVLGAIAVALVALTWSAFAAWRRGLVQSGPWFLLSVLAMLCMAGIWLSGSAGVAIATAAGFAMLGVSGWAAVKLHPNELRRLIAFGMLTLVIGALAGVVIRGVALPEGLLNERSLLFRWHYLQASAGIFLDAPFLGVGPDGYQQAYTQHRVPRNPEEVQSAHSMFVDWLTTLGVFGAAWVALIGVLVLRRDDQAASSHTRLASPWIFVLVGALSLIPAGFVEWPALTDLDMLLRGIAAVAFVAVAVCLHGVLKTVSDLQFRALIAAAVVVALVHGQIEMTFFQPGSAVWLLMLIGLLTRARAARTRSGLRLGRILLIPVAAAGVWIAFRGAWPALQQERLMLTAARVLNTVRGEKSNASVALRQRPASADVLEQAYERWPINVQPLNAAADQLMLAALAPLSAESGQPPSPALGLLMRAEQTIERAISAHAAPSSKALAMNIHAALAFHMDDRAQWTRSIDLGRQLALLDPNGVSGWKRLGDVLWAAGQRQEAAEAYSRALKNSARFSLDPLKQLDQRAIDVLQSRIESAPRYEADSVP